MWNQMIEDAKKKHVKFSTVKRKDDYKKEFTDWACEYLSDMGIKYVDKRTKMR